MEKGGGRKRELTMDKARVAAYRTPFVATDQAGRPGL
jgi:hypothetical protein